MQQTRNGLWLVVPYMLLAGCGVGSIGEGAEVTDVGLSGAAESREARASELFQDAPGSSSAAGSSEESAEAEARRASCMAATFQAADAPLRRLTPLEYMNSVQDVFGGVELPSPELPVDARTNGFQNGALGQSASPFAVEQYRNAAETIAEVASSHLDQWAPCSEDTDECTHEVLQWLGAKLYRRPLTSDEQQTLQQFGKEALAQSAPQAAIAMGIEALLQSPYFLYRPEFGTNHEVGDGVVELEAYELASRLAYFFTASAPDEELQAAAESGDLLTRAGYRAQTERLMADRRARSVLTDFFMEWLGLYKLDDLLLDQAAFPEFDDQLRDDLKESARLFVADALWQEDSWVALMTGSFGYVNDRLAPYFGVPAPGSDELVRVDLDPAQRRGVLTQPGALASTSHGSRHSPILRGVALLTNVLCQPPGPPPAEALGASSDDIDESAICTTRDDVYIKHTSAASCQNCHEAIDGAGFNFENYDALGRFRTEENGCAVDASGWFPNTDFSAELPDAVSLVDRLSASEAATSCFAEHLYKYALGRAAYEANGCEVEELAESLLDGGDSLQAMIFNMVMTPSFLSRPQAQ